MSDIFVPKVVFVTKSAISYEACEKLVDAFREAGSIIIRGSPRLPRGLDPRSKYVRAKSIVVLSADKSHSFLRCKPSADFQINLVRGCPGFCEYCYLQTTMGPAPYIRVMVNVDDILDRARQVCLERLPEETTFEAAAVSDPVPVERYTGSLRAAIEFFGREGLGARLRLVTKFTDIDSLVGIAHNGSTRIRFSLEGDEFHKRFERGMPSTGRKVQAAKKLAAAGYPIGFLIAPVFLERGVEPYKRLVMKLRGNFSDGLPDDTTFEFVSHRFTERARALILSRHPDTSLPMSEKGRQLRTGQFGYQKYVYPRGELRQVKQEIINTVREILPEGRIDYFV